MQRSRLAIQEWMHVRDTSADVGQGSTARATERSGGRPPGSARTEKVLEEELLDAASSGAKEMHV
jgi:hypothetical protein